VPWLLSGAKLSAKGETRFSLLAMNFINEKEGEDARHGRPRVTDIEVKNRWCQGRNYCA